jgi:15-cis-phytoene synthase
MDAVVEQSRQSMAQGSRSFGAAAKLFPRTLREDVWQLYAWCRYCDDQIDGQDHGHALTALTPAERAARLEHLRRQTEAALAGQPLDAPAFAAFQRVALRHGLDPRWPQALLDGFAMDAEGRRYENLEQTLEYCWGVAGAVGVMMAQIMGVRAPQVLRRAQDLGLAFQLTNICRDIVEDAQGGRVYLPLSRLRAHGAPGEAERLAAPESWPAAYVVAGQLLDVAEAYYRSARVGLRALPFRSALAIAAARDVYRGIGRKLRRAGPQGLGRRTALSKPALAGHLMRGLAVAVWSRAERLAPTPERAPLWSTI